MSRLHSPSNTRIWLGLALGLLTPIAGCGDDDCGTSGAPATGLVAAGDMTTLTYGTLSAGLNNDCPASDAPTGVTSLTIHGTQSDGTGLITLCVARPDLLIKQAQAIGLDMAGASTQPPVQLIDVIGTVNNCSYAIDTTQPATGTVATSGMCSNGADRAGFAMVVDASLTLARTCNGVTSPVAVSLRGRIAVAADDHK